MRKRTADQSLGTDCGYSEQEKCLPSFFLLYCVLKDSKPQLQPELYSIVKFKMKEWSERILAELK